MKKLLFLIPAALLFSGCNGLYVIPVPINHSNYINSNSYYTPNNDYYLINGEYILLPIRQYRYKYHNGRRLVFFNNSYISIYSHNHYIKHRKYNQNNTYNKKYRKVNKYDYKYNKNKKYR